MLLYYYRTDVVLKARTLSDLPDTMQSDNSRNRATTGSSDFESNVRFMGNSPTFSLIRLFGMQFLPLSIPLKEGYKRTENKMGKVWKHCPMGHQKHDGPW